MNVDISEFGAILCLLDVKGFGPVKFRTVYNRFKSFKRVFYLSIKELKLGFGFQDKVLHAINEQKLKLRKYEEEAEKQFSIARSLNAHIITFFDDFYPRNLFDSNHCIPIIYALGNIALLRERKCCAVVGTRKPTNWTVEQVKIGVKKLVNEGYTIVSGLAKGVDSIGHKTALENNGKTIAVVGSGVDIVYPKENERLREEITLSGSVIISEYKFGTKVQEFALKKRNKITVGLSQYVLIAQTSKKGGTMNAYIASKEQKKMVGVFLPPDNLRRGFDGNMKIINDQKLRVLKFTSGWDVKFPIIKNDQRLLI